MNKYDDIINMPHHVSAVRTPMPLENRAAQFAPFAALNGHDDAIAETARLTSRKPELSEEDLNILSRRLFYAAEKGIAINITCFQPDAVKLGGDSIVVSGTVRMIDEIEGSILLTDRRSVPLESVVKIEGDFPDDLEV